MIKSFGSADTQQVYNDEGKPKKLSLDICKMARVRLVWIDEAHDINQLSIPPSNRLKKLSGKRKAYHSIRINEQWRIIFQWQDGDAYDVEITDYH
ncbi:MAG: type II toxin-antitoxin system RelE/ParE family toxin [Verrucomicrobia bacterium]|nr:type II toxin-antitoxin system RelE/ParE family toxin [Verrucomicrobiota bacterium]MDA1005752.1 type II toxin-antitoxin system RelE/ParE family toxin [Verrucomicrobiota bacterium]